MQTEHNKRDIDCETCDSDPTVLQAWASDWLLKREGVESIDDLSDDDVRRLSRTENAECSIEGHCLECNGSDDGDDGNQGD